MVNEHISAQVFAGLVPQAMRATLPPSLLAQLPAMISDELRHAEQCAGVVLALGHVPVAPLPELQPMPEHPEVGRLEAVLRNILSVGCLSETVAVSIIRAEQAELEEGPLGPVLGSILADEVQHARFGWSVLGQLAPLLDDEARARTDEWLVDALIHQIEHELPRLPLNGSQSNELRQVGVCEGLEARGLFADTVGSVIVPRLEEAGFAARRAWSRAQAEAQV
jgi:hypothetical protein